MLKCLTNYIFIKVGFLLRGQARLVFSIQSYWRAPARGGRFVQAEEEEEWWYVLCTSRRELANEPLLAKIAVDTGKDEPSKVRRKLGVDRRVSGEIKFQDAKHQGNRRISTFDSSVSAWQFRVASFSIFFTLIFFSESLFSFFFRAAPQSLKSLNARWCRWISSCRTPSSSF